MSYIADINKENIMVKVNYKYIPYGEKFKYEGKEYIKGSHSIAKCKEDGKIIQRKFKKHAVVEALINAWDVVPAIKGVK
jgi:hypothetical protein